MTLGLMTQGQFAAMVTAAVDATDPGATPIWSQANELDPVAWLLDTGYYTLRPSLRGGVGVLSANVQRTTPRHERTGAQTGEYPHLKHKTIPWSWATGITQLQGNPSIGSAALYTPAAITIYAPETNERVVSSARLEVTFRTESEIASNTVQIVRGVLQLGSAPSITLDRYNPFPNTASRNTFIRADFDVTDYVNQNFTGTSISATASVAIQTAALLFCNNITIRLIVTYGFAAPGSTTRIQCIRIPIQTETTGLTTAMQELGTDGVSPAPSGAIPALDTWLPELSKTYRQITLCLWGNDGAAAGAGAATVPQVQIDSGTVINRATFDNTLQNAIIYYDQIDLTSTLAGVTNVTHTINMLGDATVTGKMCWIGGWVEVVYEYNHTTTLANNLAMYEAWVPVVGSDEISAPNPVYDTISTGTVAAAATTFTSQQLMAVLDIQEPGTVTIQNSAVFAITNVGSAAAANSKAAGQQPFRVYTPTASAMGPCPIIHRTDINGGWSLQRGNNRLPFYIHSGIGRTTTQVMYAVINYTAGIRNDVDNGNHAVNFAAQSTGSALTPGVDITPQDAGIRPPQLGNPWRLTTALIEWWGLATGYTMAIDQQAGELDDGNSLLRNPLLGDATKSQSAPAIFAASPIFNRSSLASGALNPMARRRQSYIYDNNAGACAAWSWWFTYQQHAYAVTGTATYNSVNLADGSVIEIWASDPGNFAKPAELVTTTTTVGGAFAVNVPDNTRNYFASYNGGSYAGRSLYGTPGSSTFNIVMNPAGTPSISRSQVVNA